MYQEIARRYPELIAAQTNLQQLEARADSLSQQREDAAKRAATLEAKVSELTQLARDRGQALDQQLGQVAKQQELLDHDRDIRELMGARDLYIAEVHDVVEPVRRTRLTAVFSIRKRSHSFSMHMTWTRKRI
jgi:chromosome segregation ATPase